MLPSDTIQLNNVRTCLWLGLNRGRTQSAGQLGITPAATRLRLSAVQVMEKLAKFGRATNSVVAFLQKLDELADEDATGCGCVRRKAANVAVEKPVLDAANEFRDRNFTGGAFLVKESVFFTLPSIFENQGLSRTPVRSYSTRVICYWPLF